MNRALAKTSAETAIFALSALGDRFDSAYSRGPATFSLACVLDGLPQRSNAFRHPARGGESPLPLAVP
jgi:hypothetical protein